jgi:hypothetical protein
MKPELNTLLLLEKKEARIAELEDWKAQAMTVLGDWSALFDALPDNYTQQPKFLGSSLSVIIGGYIMELQDENARLREALDSIMQWRNGNICELRGHDLDMPDRHIQDAESALADHFRDAAKMVSDGWLHIATAPKDGTWIIIGHPEWRRSADGYWSDDFREWRTSGIPPSPQPTHWQPLPILPNTAGGKEEA